MGERAPFHDARGVEAAESDAVGVSLDQACGGFRQDQGPEHAAAAVDGGEALLRADEERPAALAQRGDAAYLGQLLRVDFLSRGFGDFGVLDPAAAGRGE